MIFRDFPNLPRPASPFLLRRGRTQAYSTRLLLTLVLLLFGSTAAAQQTCPDMQPYYAGSAADWPRIVAQLIVLQPACLLSAEYYALLGAAQLNGGAVTPALEALERALLLQPDNGAAAVDYAQALYLAGQLFPALELNASLLQRNDLPPELGAMLQQRDAIWRAQTRKHGFFAEVALGYDNNLNSAPARSDFTLTLSGENLQLTIDEQFRPLSGPYANVRLGGNYQWLGPARTHDLVFGVRNRQSELFSTEILQSDWRYALGIPLRRYRWDFVAGSTHLLFGGSPLFSAAELRVRLRQRGDKCQPLAELAAQRQAYHQQNFMAGVEIGLTGGVECQFDENTSVLGIEVGAVRSQALTSTRPGGDRAGWVVRLAWQQALGRGVLRSQYSLASLEDATGYSELLADGARRQIYSRQLRVQYLRPLPTNLTLQYSVSHQRQGSNLAPFENRGTTVDIGLSLAL